MKDCHALIRQLDDYLDRRLEPHADAWAVAHLAACPDCRERVRRARRLHERLREYPVAGPDPEFSRRVFDRIHPRGSSSRRTVPWFAGAAIAATLVLAVAAGVLYLGAAQENPMADESPMLDEREPGAGVSGAS